MIDYILTILTAIGMVIALIWFLYEWKLQEEEHKETQKRGEENIKNGRLYLD